MTLPVAPVTMPGDLAGQTNGKLNDNLLSPVDGGGKLHHLAARAWRALVANVAAETGMPMTYTHGGTYRSYAAQETLFRSRYDPAGTGGGCKTWNGVRWCKKSANLATAAVPGTSNHGWGLAIDSAHGTSPSGATSVTSHHAGWDWILDNAERFGFSWELQSEPWHIRYVTGDMVPVAVLAFENPTPPTTTTEVEMIAIDYKPNTPEWTALTYTGSQLAHVFDGHADGVIRRMGVQRAVVSDAELDGLIRSSQTTTPCPPAWVNTARGAAWSAARG
jgi:hypothetical protein